ncbi:MAG TPA: hypothetical protein VIT65_18300 [Microlunatus sp.]
MSSAPATARAPRTLLVALGVLAVVFVAALLILISVVRPPSYEPVPVPSVSRA